MNPKQNSVEGNGWKWKLYWRFLFSFSIYEKKVDINHNCNIYTQQKWKNYLRMKIMILICFGNNFFTSPHHCMMHHFFVFVAWSLPIILIVNIFIIWCFDTINCLIANSKILAPNFYLTFNLFLSQFHFWFWQHHYHCNISSYKLFRFWYCNVFHLVRVNVISNTISSLFIWGKSFTTMYLWFLFDYTSWNVCKSQIFWCYGNIKVKFMSDICLTLGQLILRFHPKLELMIALKIW